MRWLADALVWRRTRSISAVFMPAGYPRAPLAATGRLPRGGVGAFRMTPGREPPRGRRSGGAGRKRPGGGATALRLNFPRYVIQTTQPELSHETLPQTPLRHRWPRRGFAAGPRAKHEG